MTIEVIPRTAKTLKILDPSKFPKEILFSFLKTATIEVTSSGILVPTETIVIPIILSLIPKELARLIAPEINHSEPKYKKTPPKNKRIKDFGKEGNEVTSKSISSSDFS